MAQLYVEGLQMTFPTTHDVMTQHFCDGKHVIVAKPGSALNLTVLAGSEPVNQQRIRRKMLGLKQKVFTNSKCCVLTVIRFNKCSKLTAMFLPNISKKYVVGMKFKLV